MKYVKYFCYLPEASKKSSRPIILIVVYFVISTEPQDIRSTNQEQLFRNKNFPALCGLAYQISSLLWSETQRSLLPVPEALKAAVDRGPCVIFKSLYL